MRVVLKAGLTPIFCIGENYEQREKGETKKVLETQLVSALDGISFPILGEDFVVAYEPVWAISDGDPYKTKELPTPEKVAQINEFIRSVLAKLYSPEFAGNIRIIYGGSSNAGNAGDYLKNGKVQGFLVGGASLDAEEFSQIIKLAS